MKKEKEIDIQLLKNGNIPAFTQVVNIYQRQVFTTCLGFVHNAQDAEDLAQDVFVEVYRSISKFRSEAKLSTWIYRIAVNKSLNHLRKNKKNKMLVYIETLFAGPGTPESEMHPVSESTEADKDVNGKELLKVLNDAIDSLPKNQKTAFVLAKFDELSYQEITEIMKISLSSVESLIHRAKLGLQKKLINFKNDKY